MPHKDPIRAKEYKAKRYIEKKKDYRNVSLKRLYGITVDEADNLFAKQGYVCAACGSPTPDRVKGWHVDHDHELNQVRGILCGPCNRIAGATEDHILRLRLVTRFLEKFYGRD